MGMAASQARHLALVARKSNCEYEGQQINQARTALANQSADLFNQMLGLKVPVPPSTQEFTKNQYSFKDGTNVSTIDSWQQLSEADPDYNYVVTHHYYTDRYTGSMKMLSDPQVQFPVTDAATLAQISEARTNVALARQALDEAKKAQEEAKDEYTKANAELNAKKIEAKTLSSYATPLEADTVKAEDDGTYTVTDTDPKSYTFTSYKSLIESSNATLTSSMNEMLETLGITDTSEIYFYCNGDDAICFAFKDDLDSLISKSGGVLNTYNTDKVEDYENEIKDLEQKVSDKQSELNDKNDVVEVCQEAYDSALEAYSKLNHPGYIGNCPLTALGDLTSDQQAEINQILADMKEQEIDASIADCFDENGNYIGGLYSFKLNGVIYYTTYADLENSYASGTGNNHIDGQLKLAYYNATYVSTKIEKTERALLETDGTGRFTSVRFEDNSITYTLNMESVTDDVAYQDAMNEYYYENAKYDKMVQDINAKTKIIQQQDQQLELRLKQLDTEQNALSNEIEAVSKVVKDNVEKSFKTFGG